MLQESEICVHAVSERFLLNPIGFVGSHDSVVSGDRGMKVAFRSLPGIHPPRFYERPQIRHTVTVVGEARLSRMQL